MSAQRGKGGGDCDYAEMEWRCCKQDGHEGPHESAPLTSVGYRPPICGGCGHPVGDHQSAGTGWPHPQRYGLCHYTGCACREFISDNPDSDSNNFDRLQDARAEHHGELPRDFYEEAA